MPFFTRYIVRGTIPLILTLCVVLAGFTVIHLRHSRFHLFEQKRNQQVINATAIKDLSELIVSDLRESNTYFYRILVATDEEQQQQLLLETQQTITEITMALDVITKGGTLVREPQDHDTKHEHPAISIHYIPTENQPYRSETLELRSQLEPLTKKLHQTVTITKVRNQILNDPQGRSMQQSGRQVRNFASTVHEHFDHIEKIAKKIAHDSNQQLITIYFESALEEKHNQKMDVLWAVMTVAIVFGCICLIYRQIMFTQMNLKDAIEQLQQSEQNLHNSNDEIVQLNRSLEERVDSRTKELQTAEKQWSDAFDAVSSPIFLHDRDGKLIKANKAYLVLSNSTIDHAIGRFYWDLFPKQQGPLSGCIAHTDSNNLACHHKLTITTDNKIFSSQSFAIFDPLDQFLYSVHLMEDITELSEQQARLRLSSKVFESTTEGIIITDKEGTILAVNPAFCAITGYTEQEALGQNPKILKSGRHDEDYYQEMWQTLIKTGKWKGEIWNKRKDGHIYPELLTISSILDDNGETTHYVAVFMDITAINDVVKQLDHLAHHHPLTQLPNRRLLHARLNHSMQRATRDQHHGAVIYVDLDNFKNINDSLGHAAGDGVLKDVATRLQDYTREVDTVAHLGGDEFVIVLDQVRTVNDAVTWCEKVLVRLNELYNVDNYELFVSSSLGIALFPDDGISADDVLKNADTAMFKAKEKGKNSYHIYSPELTEAALERVVLESHLRHAIEKNELILHYQPQVTLPGGDVIACEALVRWQHPELGLIAPDRFIPLSEETGLIVSIGEWVLRTACQQWVKWHKQGLELRRIAVNLSGRQIQQKELPEMVQRILEETGCPAHALELEITESFLMQHPQQSIAVLQKIKGLGVELSIDDFGTGHSSLNYLKRFPVNRLKIDRSFVADVPQDEEDNALVKAIIAIGKSLKLNVIAEGIETLDQSNFLTQNGCDEGQGYLYSRPVDANQIESMLKNNRTS